MQGRVLERERSGGGQLAVISIRGKSGYYSNRRPIRQGKAREGNSESIGRVDEMDRYQIGVIARA